MCASCWCAGGDGSSVRKQRNDRCNVIKCYKEVVETVNGKFFAVHSVGHFILLDFVVCSFCARTLRSTPYLRSQSTHTHTLPPATKDAIRFSNVINDGHCICSVTQFTLRSSFVSNSDGRNKISNLFCAVVRQPSAHCLDQRLIRVCSKMKEATNEGKLDTLVLRTVFIGVQYLWSQTCYV